VTSSVTWPFDSLGAISYRCSIVTKSLSPAIFEIMSPKHIGVTTLTFLGHVTSSVTWPIYPPYVISYLCPVGIEPLSLTVFEIFSPKTRARTHTDRRRKWSYSLPHAIALDRQINCYVLCSVVSQWSCAPVIYSVTNLLWTTTRSRGSRQVDCKCNDFVLSHYHRKWFVLFWINLTAIHGVVNW